MRVALCLSGLIGSKDGSYSIVHSKDYKPIDCEIGFEHYKEHILSKNDVDVFVHTWSIDKKDAIMDLYKPKEVIFQKQVDFQISHINKFTVCSRWYSIMQSVNLKSLYETIHEFKYDCVMIGRFDVAWYTDVIFDNFDMQYMWVSHYNDPPNLQKGRAEANRKNRGVGKEVLDFWFFSNSDYINRLSTLYNRLKKYPRNAHMCIHSHIKRMIGKDNIRFAFYRWFDYELIRRKILGCRDNEKNS